MTRDSQKRVEVFWTERLCDRLGAEYAIAIEEPNKFPDVVLKTPAGNVGVEVSEVYLDSTVGQKGGSPARAAISLKEKLVRRASELHRASGASPVYAQVLFHPTRTLSLKAAEVERVAFELVEFLVAHPPSGIESERHYLYEAAPGIAPPLSTVHARAVKPEWLPAWQVVGTDLVRPLRSGDFSASIAAKNKRLASLGEPDREYWLLLVVDRGAGASSMSLPESLDLSASRFSRTFVLKHPDALYEDGRQQSAS